jgi:hypothetical protein
MRLHRLPCTPHRPRTPHRGRYCRHPGCHQLVDRRLAYNRARHNTGTQRSSHRLHSGSSSVDHRWRSHCRRRKRHLPPGCIRRYGHTAHRAQWSRHRHPRFRRLRWCSADHRSRPCLDHTSRHCCGSSSGRRRSRSRSRRRPRPPPTDCIDRSACIPHRAPTHRCDYSCIDHSRNRGRHSTRHCSHLQSTPRPRCGSSSTGRRRQTRCQRRRWLRHSGCIEKTRCIAPRERARPTSSFPTRCHRRCRSRRRDSRSIERRSCTRRRCCGSSCGRRRRQCRCWHKRPTRQSGYIRWSTCTRRRATAHR